MNLNRLLPIVFCVLSLLLGLLLGWRLGYRALTPAQKQLLQEYRTVKEDVGLSDAEWADLLQYVPQMREDLERSDEWAAGMALLTLRSLERGRDETARAALRYTISIYYHAHRRDGNSNLLAKIERYAATNAPLSNWIYRPVIKGSNVVSELEWTAAKYGEMWDGEEVQ